MNSSLTSKQKRQVLSTSKMEAGIFSLTSEFHEAIASHLELEDLLLLGSTCQHFHRLISASESEAIWTQLYNTYWGTTAHPDGISARAAFKMRCARIWSPTAGAVVYQQ